MTDENIQELKKEKKKQLLLLLFSIILIFIIIWLLYQKITTDNSKKNTGNLDIFEIKCNNNCSCSDDLKYPQKINKLDRESSLSNMYINHGTLNFRSDITNYNIILENSINEITLKAISNSIKAKVYYIYNKKVYSSFDDMLIFDGENIISVIVVAEDGSFTNYRVSITRLNARGEIIKPVIKDNNANLSDISISDGSLVFEKDKTNYSLEVDSSVKKITLKTVKESSKSLVYYVYKGVSYNEFKDVKISYGTNIITIVVTAEDGSSKSYIVVVKKKSNDLSTVEGLEWSSTNDLNIFSNPAYDYEPVIAPGSTNSYEFIIRNVVDSKVLYKLIFDEESKFSINMKYRLKKNGEYLVGSEKEWVSYRELSTADIELDYNRADDYILDWKWEDGDNDNLIGSLQNDYTLSITLSAKTLVD